MGARRRSGQRRKANVLATTPAGANVANTLYTHATPAPTVTRISGIGNPDRRTSVTITDTNPTGAKAATASWW